MDLEQFIEKTPYLYHLTSQTNAVNIIAQRQLFSANELISLSGDNTIQNVKREKRTQHFPLTVNGVALSLRDQQPISLVALPKCLTDNWSVSDFLYHLNDRVFMWPPLGRLCSHFGRYESEHPVIFRFDTQSLMDVNPHVKFCRLNSGATRANSYLGGKPPERGPNTFQSAADFDLPVGKVAEVTFEGQCTITGSFSSGGHPDGPFHQVV
ncbi:MAG TPA: hypothetical protein VHS53_17675 [Mucilaginibacter sp.]|nr:hypothetical protein [Mucilaginibacter sp.]